MTEQLIVDPTRLKPAAAKLQGLVFPVPPSPIVAPGTDSVSAAINETLPIIESPVIDGLPAVKAALTRTGSSIVAAADIYADADQKLGEHVSSVQFLSAGEKIQSGGAGDRPVGAAADQPVGAAADQSAEAETPGTPIGVTPSTPRPALPLDQIVPQLNQMAGTLSPLAQNVSQVSQSITQSVQGATGSMSGGGMPARLADDITKTEQSPSDQAQLVDETEKDGDEEERASKAFAGGAAPGHRASEGVPVQAQSVGHDDQGSYGDREYPRQTTL
jgi:hypothetical protein